MKKAIILLNMGGARNALELKDFLYNMFRDKRIINTPFRYLLAPLISSLRYKKIWEKYKLINGSRIYKVTASLVSEMQKITDYEVIYSMRYTKPNLNDIIHKYDEVALIPLFPHYSTTTVESHLDELKATQFKGKISVVSPFFDNTTFNKIVTENILKSIDNHKEWHLIFSAHGLPQKIINKGDIYQEHIKKHVELLSKELTVFQSISLAYQSKLGPVKWLKPYMSKHLQNFKGKKVLIYPLSFMIDNSETDLELKIEYAELARKIGITDYKVVTCPNDGKEIAHLLVTLAQEIKKPNG